jgi:hypothetical protein
LNRTKRKALQLKVDTLLEDVWKRIVPVGGDIRSFRLNQKFGLVIAPFRAFLHNRVSSAKRRNLEFRECVSQPKAHVISTEDKRMAVLDHDTSPQGHDAPQSSRYQSHNIRIIRH